MRVTAWLVCKSVDQTGTVAVKGRPGGIGLAPDSHGLISKRDICLRFPKRGIDGEPVD